MSLYDKIKGAKNISPWTTSYIRRNPNARVYLISDTYKGLQYSSLRSRAKDIIIGRPINPIPTRRGTVTKVANFFGARLNKIFTCQLKSPTHVGAYYAKAKWCRDITDEWVKRYVEYGRCALHNEGHVFIDRTSKKRVCAYCQARSEEKRFKVEKVEWKQFGGVRL